MNLVIQMKYNNFQLILFCLRDVCIVLLSYEDCPRIGKIIDSRYPLFLIYIYIYMCVCVLAYYQHSNIYSNI